MIVEDSSAMRRLIRAALDGDPDVEVVGDAPDGRQALAQMPGLRPDILILDLEMPELDGLQTMAALRLAHSEVKVIVFSAVSREGAEATFRALSLGAKDFVPKPTGLEDFDAAVERTGQELLPRIKLFCSRVLSKPRPGRVPPAKARPGVPAPGRAPSSVPPGPDAPLEPGERVDAVVIGVSTGGPAALQELLPALPPNLPVPVAIVQHMPPVFTRQFAERLNVLGPLRVAEGEDGALMAPGTVWLAPGGRHLALERRGENVRLRLDDGPPENFCRPAVDVLLRSAVAVYGPRVLAVIMTGMGEDGLKGCRAVRAAGGRVVVQDEESSVVWGMPGAVAEAGLAHAVLPLSALADAVSRCARARRGTLLK